MSIYAMYAIIFGLLFVAELVYFRIADKCNICLLYTSDAADD